MVKIVYNSRRRIEVNQDITVGKAIEMVADNSQFEHCYVFFNDERLNNETIPGIKNDHTLRVVCVNKGAPANLPTNTPTAEKFIKAYERMTEKDNQMFIGFVEGPEFKQKMLTKLPALASDGQVLSILSDHVLAYEYVERNEEQFFKDHPLFLPALYAMFEFALNRDVINRLFSDNYHVPQQNMFNPDSMRQMLNFLPTPAASSASTNQPSSSRTIFTPEMFASALQSVETRNTPPSIRSTPPVSDNPLELYASQLNQLHEYGFLNDDENVLALVEAEGNIELALEFIIRNREAMDLD